MADAAADAANAVETWGPAELAQFLGYRTSTITRMVSEQPERLPPRMRSLHKPRWLPEVVREWAKQDSRPLGTPVRVGRPRNPY